jgi:hypothetical protein
LANLERVGQLHAHQPDLAEIEQHIFVADEHIADSQRMENSLATRFSVANTAGHSLLIAAIKMRGYRPAGGKGHRSVLYQLLDELLPGAAGAKTVLANCHNRRNKMEYDGEVVDFTAGEVVDLIEAVKSVREEVAQLLIAYRRTQAKSPP